MTVLNSMGMYNRSELPRLVVEKGPRSGVGQSTSAPAPARKKVPQSTKKKSVSFIVPTIPIEENLSTFTINEPLVVIPETSSSGKVAGVKTKFRSFKYKRRLVDSYKHKFY